MYLSLVASQEGGIHVEEEFNPWVRVNGIFSQMTGNFVVMTKICSGLMVSLDLWSGTISRKVEFQCKFRIF